jgi:hypothetical protein
MAQVRRMEYPVKVLVAWGEAISGDRGMRDWLIKNGYPELGIFTFALYLKPDARKWLMQHGHAHLMAIIRGIEGDEKALEWLDAHDMHVLRQMAVAGGDEEALQWLIDKGHRALALLALKMWSVKMAIEEEHNDPYTFSQD